MFHHGITLQEVHERLFQPRPGRFGIQVLPAQERRTPFTSVNFLEDFSNHGHPLILLKLSYISSDFGVQTHHLIFSHLHDSGVNESRRYYKIDRSKLPSLY
jgi:hypothetical protein